MITCAKAAVSGTAYGFDIEYTYRVPERLVGSLRPGQRILVPFGRGNKRRPAFILRIYEREDEEGIKPLLSVIDPEPLIGDEQLRLIKWLKENTFCTFYEAFRTLVPSGYSVSLSVSYCLSSQRPTEEDILDLEERELYDSLISEYEKNGVGKGLDKLLKNAEPRLLESLAEKGLLERADEVKRRVGDEQVTMIELSEEYYRGEVSPSDTPKQRAAEEFLKENQPASLKEMMYYTGLTRTVISGMVKKGVLRSFKFDSFRTPKIEGRGQKPEDITLSSEQQSAYDGIMEMISENKPAGALLYGVTGSGKTAVFIKLIDSVTKSGKTAVMLVPEISLTPQLVGRFKAAFGDTVAVIHSALSIGQRMDEFKRAKNGSAKIVIGTRSAVFAPLPNIGLIIMDEEGESSYKSEMNPKYHARDVAIQRCGEHNCVLLMASATPSLETFYYAKSGRYRLFELKHRFNETELPEVVVADMAVEAENGNRTPFCEDLIRAVNENIKSGKQSIFLLNRRGYSPYVICPSCHGAVKCPNCLLPLNYHKSNGRLMCHICGYSVPFHDKCPVCGDERIRTSGAGTQLIEEELEALFPGANILRMDADSASSRLSFEEKFRDFEDGKYDIMIGTQMIAKGLDFPNVTLVGVISLDSSLFSGSYKSFERTFSLLTQVVGRGGRGTERGVAYIQTYIPDHHVIALASKQDYEGFFDQEISLRHELIYPPFCDIMVISFSAASESAAASAASSFVGLMKEAILQIPKEKQFPLRVLGPARTSQGRANGRYRWGLTIKCRNSSAFRQFISGLLIKAYKDKNFQNVTVSPDMNPENMY